MQNEVCTQRNTLNFNGLRKYEWYSLDNLKVSGIRKLQYLISAHDFGAYSLADDADNKRLCTYTRLDLFAFLMHKGYQ